MQFTKCSAHTVIDVVLWIYIFVDDIFSFVHMCASVFWEENNTNWQVTVNKLLNVYLIFIIIYEQFC